MRTRVRVCRLVHGRAWVCMGVHACAGVCACARACMRVCMEARNRARTSRSRSLVAPAADTYKRLLLAHRDYAALNVYVALCYARLDYFDVSQVGHGQQEEEASFSSFCSGGQKPTRTPHPRRAPRPGLALNASVRSQEPRCACCHLARKGNTQPPTLFRRSCQSTSRRTPPALRPSTSRHATPSGARGRGWQSRADHGPTHLPSPRNTHTHTHTHSHTLTHTHTLTHSHTHL